MTYLSKMGTRPKSPLDLESLHSDSNVPCRVAFMSVHNYFLGRYFLVHMVAEGRETPVRRLKLRKEHH